MTFPPMKKLRPFALCLLGAAALASLSSCATTHLWRWGLGETSVIERPDEQVVRGFVMPAATVLGTPLAVGWDIVTVPFQLGFMVYPYGSEHMVPPPAPEQR